MSATVMEMSIPQYLIFWCILMYYHSVLESTRSIDRAEDKESVNFSHFLALSECRFSDAIYCYEDVEGEVCWVSSQQSR